MPLSHLVLGDSLQRQASPYANIIQQMQSVRLVFPTVTLLCESRHRQNGAHSPLWCHVTGTHRHSGWKQLIFSRCKSGCNHKGLLTRDTLFLFWLSGRINFHEKVRVTLICIWCGSIDAARLWATVWHRSASGKCRPASIKKSVTRQLWISELMGLYYSKRPLHPAGRRFICLPIFRVHPF